MSDSEDDVPIALLAKNLKEERRREQLRASQKRKREREKNELSQAELAAKRRAECERVKCWIKKKKAENPEEFKENMRLVKEKQRANMSGYKKRWVRYKDARAKQVRRAEEKANDERTKNARQKNTLKVKMWRNNKTIPAAPDNSQSPAPSTSTATIPISRGARKKGRKVRQVLSSMRSPIQKANVLASVLHSSTPRTKSKLKEFHVLADEGDRLALEGVKTAVSELHERRDDDAIRAKGVLKVTVNAAGAKRKLSLVSKAVGLDRKSTSKHLSKWKAIGPKEFKWVTYNRRVRSDALSDSTCQLVREHYYDSTVSRELPLKKEVVRIKVGPKQYTEVPKRMMEVTLSEAYEMFEKQHGKLLGQRKYEMLRPIEVILPKLSLRLVCGCSYHVNVFYLQQALNRLLLNTGLKSYKSTGDLSESTLCKKDQESEFHKMTCIKRCCESCGTRLLIDHLEQLKLRCSKSCQKSSCLDCTTTYNTYKYVDIVDKAGDKKRRLQLVSITEPISSFLQVLQLKLEPFSNHRHMAYWQYCAYKTALQNLKPDEIAITLDFAENYSCVVPHEVMSMHWTQVQASLFIGVLVRHAVLELDGKESTEEEPWLVEEELVAILDDHRHDHHAVKHCRKLFLNYLQAEQELKLRRIMEFCDGAAVQFKCTDSLSDISNHEADHNGIQVIRTWWETAHGKGRADGAGAVVKHSASMAVVRQDRFIRSASELFEFCKDTLEIQGQQQEVLVRQHKVTRRKFFYIPAGDIDRSESGMYRTHKGVRSLHQVFSCNKTGVILTREVACCCSLCLDGEFHLCSNLSLVGKPSTAQLTRRDKLSEAGEEEAPEEEQSELEGMAACLVGENVACADIVVIAAHEELTPYYLMVATAPATVLDEETTDSYRNRFSQGARVVMGNYLELLPKSSNVYYREDKKTACVYVGCIRGICPELQKHKRTVRGKDIDVFEVSPDIHEALLSLVTF